MKILKPGKFSDNKWKMEHLCTGYGNGGGGCEALLEIELEDLRYYPYVDTGSWGSHDSAVLFKCPICQTLTDLKNSDWPKNAGKILTPFTSAWKNGEE